MLVSKAELPAEDHEVVIAATSIGADTSSGPNGKFNRLWMFDGEGTTSYPLDPSKWSTNYQPGNTSVRPHAKGILVTWHPYNQGVPANNDQLRVHGYEFTDAMSTLGQSPQAFPFTPSASPYFFETSKRGNILAFKAIPPTGIGETTAEFQTTDLAEIGARYGKHLGISVHRRRQKLRIVRVKVLDIAPPPPPDLIPPRVNTSGYFDLGTASSASALATKITNADSLTNCKVRMTGDIASDFTISKKMAPNMELAIDLGGNKLIDTNIFCNKMEGITFHNGIFYGSTQTRAGRISFNGGAKRCRVSDIEVFGSGYDNTLDASAPVAEVSSIIVDRCTVDKRFLDANRTSVANNTLCGSGGGESQSFFKLASTSGFEGNNCRDFIVAKIFFKYAICPGSGPGVGKSKPTNGYDAQVRALMCRWTSNMKFCYQIHNKCGGVWVMGCDIEGDDGWQFLNRHGIDNYWMGCYLRKNGMLRLMDYDGIMANCEAAPGVTGAGAQIYGGTQQADWPKGDLPNLTSFYARCINTIIYNNRGPMDIVIGNMPESSKDSNGNYIYSHYPPKNIQVWPHAAGIISKGSTPGSTWVDKTGTPAQWIVDLSNKFQPRPLVEGVDVGRGAN